MKWPALRYAKADDLDAVWSLLDAAGENAKVIAGGQSLLASLAFRLSNPGVLIDISGVSALKGIALDGETLRIGALTTHAQLGRDGLVARHAPLLHQAVPLIAHAAIRNRGTVGGNIAYADPASELPACLVALGGTVVAVSRSGERRIAADDFFVGLFETALEPGELVAAIEVPAARAGELSAILEVSRRAGDYAMAGLAAWSDGRAARLAYFGVGERPVLARAASAALISDGVAAARAALASDLEPIGDQHATAEMKLHLASVLTGRIAPLITPPGKAAA